MFVAKPVVQCVVSNTCLSVEHLVFFVLFPMSLPLCRQTVVWVRSTLSVVLYASRLPHRCLSEVPLLKPPFCRSASRSAPGQPGRPQKQDFLGKSGLKSSDFFRKILL